MATVQEAEGKKKARASHFEAEIIEIIDEAPDVKTFRLSCPQDWTFLPGQFVMIWFRDVFGNDKRAYSISSSPHTTAQGFFDLTIKLYGKFTHHLWTLDVGDTIEARGPFGRFTLNLNSSAPVVGIAGGVGVTPIFSMMRYLIEQKSKRKMVLFYSNRQPEEIVFFKELIYYEKLLPNFHVVNTLTRLKPERHWRWPGLRGRFSKEVYAEYLPKYLDGILDIPEFYICGTVPMIESTIISLQELGYPEESIKFEKFW